MHFNWIEFKWVELPLPLYYCASWHRCLFESGKTRCISNSSWSSNNNINRNCTRVHIKYWHLKHPTTHDRVLSSQSFYSFCIFSFTHVGFHSTGSYARENCGRLSVYVRVAEQRIRENGKLLFVSHRIVLSCIRTEHLHTLILESKRHTCLISMNLGSRKKSPCTAVSTTHSHSHNTNENKTKNSKKRKKWMPVHRGTHWNNRRLCYGLWKSVCEFVDGIDVPSVQMQFGIRTVRPMVYLLSLLEINWKRWKLFFGSAHWIPFLLVTGYLILNIQFFHQKRSAYRSVNFPTQWNRKETKNNLRVCKQFVFSLLTEN